MNFALRSLIETPQNNFRIFKNGNLVFGDDRTKDFQKVIADFFLSEDIDYKRLVYLYEY